MKAWKLQECVAHLSGSVTCVSLGRKSGRVMATGGEDRRVNLWAVGKPTCILSLTGHTSSVEATEFSQEEDHVAAGSLSGSIRIWDLEEVKIVRTLSGHTSGISTLDFHPVGNFIASGSIDSLVKLWDVSRKGCINTYRGHTGGVNMIRFSPDGKWLVSGGDDGSVKLWDLTAGKQLAELTGSAGAITAVAFHPTVLLLATASSDRTVRLYDLENFTQVAMSGSELATSTVRSLAFHPDGVCFYVATSDYLRIYDYETMACMDTIHVGWRAGGGLDDMAIAPSFNQLVGASANNSTLSTYVVDIKSCAPFAPESPAMDAPQSRATTPQSMVAPKVTPATDESKMSNGEMNNNKLHLQMDRPFTRCGSADTGAHQKNRKSFCLGTDNNSANVLKVDPNDPESRIPYKPCAEEQSDMMNTDMLDPEEYNRVFRPRHAVERSPSRTSTSRVANVDSSRAADGRPISGKNVPAESPKSSVTASKEERRPTPNRNLSSARVSKAKNPPVSPEVVNEPEDILTGFAKRLENSKPTAPVRGDDARVNLDAPTSNEPSEFDWLTSVRKSHSPFMSVMSARVKGLSTVRMMWTRSNIRTALETTLMLNEPAVLVDILSVLALNSAMPHSNCSSLWNLELVITVLPHLLPLVKSKYPRHVETACQAIHVILKNFAQLIRQTLAGPIPPGVDLVREERQRKCQDCMDHLISIRSALSTPEVAAKAGQCGRELNVRFQTLS